jgi:1,4-dihydroxy-2-naphthoate octaprenyltransferase
MFLTCTLVPVSLGGALAYRHLGTLDWPLFLLTLLGVSIAHLGVNLANDYFDFRLGADRPEHDQRPYSGGGDAITRDGVAPETVRRWFWTCFAVAFAIGLAILLRIETGRALVLAITVLGFLGGYFYTAPPLRLAYRGWGEADIFVFLGPAPVLGTFAVLTGTLTPAAVVCSLPIAGLIAALLWINEYTDFDSDRAAGKRNLVVRLGRRRARWGYAALMAFVFAAIVGATATGAAPAWYLVALLPLPPAWRSVRTAIAHPEDPDRIKSAQGDALKVHLATGLLCALGAALGGIP